jgi:hypothetical protein
MRRISGLLAALCTAGALQAQTAPAPDAAELLFWESIRNSSLRADFEEYLRQYPEGKFAGLARNRLNAASRACDISGTWIGRTWMDGIGTESRIELQISGDRITGTRLAMTVAERYFPAAPITGKVGADGIVKLMEAPTHPTAGPTAFDLFVNDACSVLRGKFTVTVQGHNYGGTAGYLRHTGASQ